MTHIKRIDEVFTDVHQKKTLGDNYCVMAWSDWDARNIKRAYPELFSEYDDDTLDGIAFDGFISTLNEFISILEEFSEKTNTKIELSAPGQENAECSFGVVGTEIGGVFILTDNNENPKILQTVVNTKENIFVYSD